MNLNHRQINLIEEILYSKQLKLSHFAKNNNVSRQTIYEDIEFINYWLGQNNFGKIVKHEGVLTLNLSDYTKITESIALIRHQWNFYDKNERIAWIIFQLLFYDHVTTDILRDLSQVSKTTIVNDMKEIRELMQVHNIQLVHIQGKYQFLGDEINVRIALLNSLSSYIKHFYHDKMLKNIYKKFVTELAITNYSKLSLDILALGIAISVRRNAQGYYLTQLLDNEYIQTNEEEEILAILINKGFVSGENIYEQQYILFLIHAFIKIIPSKNYVDIIEYYTSFTILKFKFINTQDFYWSELEEIIFYHFLSLIFRQKLGIVLFNTLLQDIQTKYSYIYYCSKHILMEMLGNQTEELLLIHEAGYLSLLFLTQLDAAIKNIKPNVLVVCYEGISASRVLAQQLEAINLDINIVSTSSFENINEYEAGVDYIISTIPLNNVSKPTIYVRSILTAIDKKKILKIFKIKGDSTLSINEFFNIIQKHVDSSQLQQIMQEVLHNVTDITTEQDNLERSDMKIMLSDLLNKETIQVKKSCTSWEDALQLVAQPLLDNQNITPQYLTKIKENLTQFGEYIILRDGFALPHARPEDGVLKIGMSLLKLEEPVYMNNNLKQPIYLIVVLAAEDAQKHLTALSNLVDYIADDDDFEKILKITEKSELVNLFAKN